MAYKQGKEQGRQSFSGTRRGHRLPRLWLVWGGAAVAVISILIVIAGSQSGSGSGDSPTLSADRRIAVPDFPVALYQGADVLGSEEVRFSEVFRHGKPVVLNFWAGLCPPCRAEMPGFQKVYDEFGGQFILVGLDIGPFIGLGSSENGRNMLQELGITYPAGTTSEAGTVAAYRIRGMPTTVFLTPQGEILDTHIGILDEGTFRDKVQDLIRESEAS